MPAIKYVTNNGPFSVVGLVDAGANWDRSPDIPNDSRWRRWPTHITVPTSYKGSGRALDVRLCFEEALGLVHDCIHSRTQPACDTYFRDLGKDRAPDMRRSLTDLLGYQLVFFRNGAPNPADDFLVTAGPVSITMGEMLTTNNITGFAVISISAYCARSPVSLAATIVHELAHCAGAPGRPSAADWAAMNASQRAPYFSAEKAVQACGMSDQYKPDIYGEIQEHFQRAMSFRSA